MLLALAVLLALDFALVDTSPLALAVGVALMLGVAVSAAGLKDGVATAEGAGRVEAAAGLDAEVEPTGAGTASGPLALAELFRLAITAIASNSTRATDPSARARRIQ